MHNSAAACVFTCCGGKYQSPVRNKLVNISGRNAAQGDAIPFNHHTILHLHLKQRDALPVFQCHHAELPAAVDQLLVLKQLLGRGENIYPFEQRAK